MIVSSRTAVKCKNAHNSHMEIKTILSDRAETRDHIQTQCISEFQSGPQNFVYINVRVFHLNETITLAHTNTLEEKNDNENSLV